MRLSFSMTRRALAGAVLACVAATSASAVPLKWFLQDVAFSNSATATGSFIYDDDFLTFSSFDITVSQGGADVQTNILAGFSGGLGFDVFGPTGGTAGETFLQLIFSPVLTNAGGTSALTSGSFVSTCTSTGSVSPASCPLGAQYGYISGSVTTSPVPLPAGFGLLLAGLGILGFARKSSKF